MRDDVVELPEILLDIKHVHLFQADIRKPKPFDHMLPFGYGGSGKIDSQELAPGAGRGEWNDVRPVAASQLQHTAGIHGCGLQTEQRGEGGQPVGMRLRVAAVVIKDCVVMEGSVFGRHWIASPIVTRRS